MNNRQIWHSRGLTIDTVNNQLTHHDQTIQLQAKAMMVLRYLLNNSDRSVSREELIQQIWWDNEGVGKRGVTNAIAKIRKSFRDMGEDSFIISTPKAGYKIDPAQLESLRLKADDHLQLPLQASALVTNPKKLGKLIYPTVGLIMVVVVMTLSLWRGIPI